MSYSLLKKLGLSFCVLLFTAIFSLVYAEAIVAVDTVLNTINSKQMSPFWIHMYIGALLSLLTYNFLLFISLRKISYLYYALLTAAILLAFGSFNGVWSTLLWPNSPQWNLASLPIGLALAGVFATQFSRCFLATAIKSPKLDKVLYRLLLAFFLTLIASLFIPLSYALYAIALLIFILCFTAIAACTSACLQGERAAQIYLIAWLILLFGISLFAVAELGWLTDSWMAHYALTLSSMIFILLLVFALSHRIIITHQQTLKLHQKLAVESDAKVVQQVSEQTTELTLLNQKLQQQEVILKKLAFYDDLTGLANRVFIQEQLKQLLSHAKRNRSKIAVLLIDLDNFKAINDEHGHKVGDDLLIIIADRLRSTLRESDVVGRLGCDKFMVLLESSREDKHDPTQVADKIRAVIAHDISMDWFVLHINISVGIALYPNDGKDAASLIAAADAAMRIEKTAKKAKKS